MLQGTERRGVLEPLSSKEMCKIYTPKHACAKFPRNVRRMAASALRCTYLAPDS